MPVDFVILGGGPAGVQAASTAARLGARVTLVEDNVVGGSANLRDCIPSKAMIATGGVLTLAARAHKLGLERLEPRLDLAAMRERVEAITGRIEATSTQLLASQGVRVISGRGRLDGARTIEVDSMEEGSISLHADAILLATGSRPRVPTWAPVDGKRVLLTRQAYPPEEIPEHLVVIGSGVTGVEFVHMFRSLGSKVTLIVSRQQILPQKDPEVAAALETDFLATGVRLLKGARAEGIEVHDDGTVTVACDDGRMVTGSHVLLAIGSLPNSESLGLDTAGVQTDTRGFVPINQHCQSNIPHIYAAGDVSGRLPLSSVAFVQGRRAAEHVMGLHTREHRHLDYDKAASAIFTEPEIADVGLAEAEAFAVGRKIRVTKVPFATNARALINGDPRGFIKIVSDPATGVVLGGSIVGERAAELISVLAVAVTNNLRVTDLAESLLVHPALAEALAEAAE
ncbi:MAG: dihydrolipoyl dehydrogenase family protein [Acidimicrobiales bacterium]|nr:FAD-dependent oxidoreductase [Actinomycetota bacterium]